MSETKFITLRDLEQFGSLELLATQVVEGFITGLHRSPYHGFSVEFAEHRQYNSGEGTRHIDWKLYARSGKYFIKKYEEETNLRCQLVIDTSGSMYFPQPGFDKLRFSIFSTAAIIHLLKKQRDAFGISLLAGSQLNPYIPARLSSGHQRLIFNRLEQLLQQSTAPEANRSLAPELHELAEQIHKRSVVVLFTDMLEHAENLDTIFSALQHLRFNRHEVVVFHVADHKQEMDLDYKNRPTLFIDVETGEKLKLQPAAVKDFYTDKMTAFVKDLKARCLQYKIELYEVDINRDFNQVLMPFFVKRSKLF